MACFVVPAAEAVIVSIMHKKAVKNEAKIKEVQVDHAVIEDKLPMSTKLSWLKYLLIGGAMLLMFEHIWHGEVVPWFPFLTAMSAPETAIEALREMAVSGTLMAVLVTVVWFIMCKAAEAILRRKSEGVQRSAA